MPKDKNNQLHSKVGQRPQSKLKKGAEWMTEATQIIKKNKQHASRKFETIISMDLV